LVQGEHITGDGYGWGGRSTRQQDHAILTLTPEHDVRGVMYIEESVSLQVII
jgi:hypothetical protein